MHSSPAQAVATELLRQHTARESFRGMTGALALRATEAAYEAQDAYVDLLLRERRTRLRGYNPDKDFGNSDRE